MGKAETRKNLRRPESFLNPFTERRQPSEDLLHTQQTDVTVAQQAIDEERQQRRREEMTAREEFLHLSTIEEPIEHQEDMDGYEELPRHLSARDDARIRGEIVYERNDLYRRSRGKLLSKQPVDKGSAHESAPRLSAREKNKNKYDQ